MFNFQTLKNLAGLSPREALYRRIVTPEVEALMEKKSCPKTAPAHSYERRTGRSVVSLMKIPVIYP